MRRCSDASDGEKHRAPVGAPTMAHGRCFPHALRTGLDDGLRRARARSRAVAAPLLDYLALLVRWNKTYNLTAIRDPHEMVGKHLLDSLAMHPFVDVRGMRHAGRPRHRRRPARHPAGDRQARAAGDPGREQRQEGALPARGDAPLGLRNARVAESRVEALDEPGAYDAITARALATLPRHPRARRPPARARRPPAGDEGRVSARRDRRAARRAGACEAVHPLHGSRAGCRTAPGRGRARPQALGLAHRSATSRRDAAWAQPPALRFDPDSNAGTPRPTLRA